MESRESLGELRARAANTRGDDPVHARALVELAESEPLLGNRLEPVRLAIDAAAAVLDRVDAPELRARLLLRLAQLKLVETDYEGADQALAAVGGHVPDHTALRFLTGVRACRVALRRGPEPRTQAGEMLLASAARLPQFDADDVLWQRVTSEVILGVAEHAVHHDPPDARAFEPLRTLLAELESAPVRADRIDTLFTGRQLLATYALSVGDPAEAISSLRAVIRIARDAESPADEIEARLALAGVLVDTGDHVAREEAAHHVQRARDGARGHELRSLHQAAQIAEAGLLARGGKLAGAIDRVIALARSAQADNDVPRYIGAVGIMAELYARSGDTVSAFRTIVEAHHALSAATGTDTTPLFRPLLASLRDRVGADRLEEIAADVAKANRLASELVEKHRGNSAG